MMRRFGPLSEVREGRLDVVVMDRGPDVIRRRMGAALKQLRTAKGYQLAHVAKGLEMSPAKLSRLETGLVPPKLRDIRDLLDEYDAPADLRKQVMEWADGAKEQGWWQPLSADPYGDLNLLISLEAEARVAKTYTPCVPGLLQSRDYASVMIRNFMPQNTQAQHDELVDVRLRRQAVLDADRDRVPSLRLQVVMDESALYRGHLSGMMAHQLRELVLRSTQPNIEVRIFPFLAGFSETISVFTIFELRQPNEGPVVFVEADENSHYYESAGKRARYKAIWEDLTAKAVGPDESRQMIEDAAAAWERRSLRV